MSPEPGSAAPEAIGGSSWRAQLERRQQQALPSGRVLVTCSAPFGGGGLGRHLREIVDALQRNGQDADYLCEGDGGGPHTLQVPRRRLLMPLTRFSTGWRLWNASVGFDRAAATRLRAADHLMGFNGTSLRQMRTASCPASVVSATAHMGHVVAQHARAHDQYPLERPWAARLLARNLAEYRRAERIYVASDYVRDSFLQRGASEDSLAHFPLTPDPRYRPAPRTATAETFDVVYVGSLSVDKGTPLLIDAIERVDAPDLRLKLVGGWKTRGMRRHVMAACARDPRITLSPGDPLEALRGASLYVHPTYSDGFGYAPAEAMACGVPVLVSEDTGMKDLVTPGENGLVLPTGDAGTLAEAIASAHRREVFAR